MQHKQSESSKPNIITDSQLYGFFSARLKI
jgi:hypothetical protein